MTPRKTTQKRYVLFALALFLLAIAAATFIFASNSFAIRILGLVAIVASVRLILASNIHHREGPENMASKNIKTGKRLKPIEWTIAAGSVLAAAGAYLYLRSDALKGYHQVMPVYIFAFVGIACALIWGYLAVKLLQ